MAKVSFLRQNNPIILKASKGESLNDLEGKSFKEEMTSNAALEVLLSDDVQKKFSVLDLDIAESMQAFKLLYLSSQQSNLVQNPKTSKKLLQDNLKTCFTNMTYAYAALPDTEQLSQFKLMSNSVLSTAKKMVEEKYKLSIEDDFGIEVVYPENRESMITGFVKQIKELTTEVDEQFKLINSFNISDLENLEPYYILASTFTNDNVFESLQNNCDRANSPFLDDAALSKLKILNLSWPTIQYPELGISIFAHEVGHIVSENYGHLGGSEKACLIKTQVGSQQYVEEDFADLFSAEVLKKLNYKIGTTNLGNMSCALHSYLPYNSGWSAGNIENPIKSDSHSSTFYRMLSFSAMTTGLTNQCTEHLNQLKENRFFDYCQWNKDNP